MKHIVLTGGGTAGHVTPNIALIPRLKELGYTISYIGSYEGIEKKLIEELGIPERLQPGQKNSERSETGRCFFQRRIRYSSCCNCGKTPENPSTYP